MSIIAFVVLCPSAFASWIGDSSLAPGVFASTVERANTYRLLEYQMRDQESRASNFQLGSYRQGMKRAHEIVGLFEDQEIKNQLSALKPLGERLQNDSSLETPAKVIAVGVAIWVGRSVSLFKSGELSLDSRVEARAKTGSLSLSSSIINSNLTFQTGNGLLLAMNREIPLIDSRAEVFFGVGDGSFRTSISKLLIEHLVLSVGMDALAHQQEGNAKLAYSVIL